jgi:hypothetical protein
MTLVLSSFSPFLFLLVFSWTKLMFGRFIDLVSEQALPFYHFKEVHIDVCESVSTILAKSGL